MAIIAFFQSFIKSNPLYSIWIKFGKIFPKNCLSGSFVLSVKHNKWSTPIVFIAYFYGLWNKTIFEKNFLGFSKSLGAWEEK